MLRSTGAIGSTSREYRPSPLLRLEGICKIGYPHRKVRPPYLPLTNVLGVLHILMKEVHYSFQGMPTNTLSQK